MVAGACGSMASSGLDMTGGWEVMEDSPEASSSNRANLNTVATEESTEMNCEAAWMLSQPKNTVTSSPAQGKATARSGMEVTKMIQNLCEELRYVGGSMSRITRQKHCI